MPGRPYFPRPTDFEDPLSELAEERLWELIRDIGPEGEGRLRWLPNQLLTAAVTQGNRIREHEGRTQRSRAPLFLLIRDGALKHGFELLSHVGRGADWRTVEATSYRGMKKGAVRVDLGRNLLPKDVKDRNVWIVDDIVDSGDTITAVKNTVRMLSQEAEVLTCALFVREGQEHLVDVSGFTVTKGQFLIGYGMDLCGRLRNLDFVTYVTKQDMDKYSLGALR